MARLTQASSSRGDYDSSSSYSSGPSYRTVYRTESLSLPEALERVISGDMRPFELFSQLPGAAQSLFDKVSNKRCDGNFSSLNTSDQKEVCRVLLEESRNPPKPLSLLDALEEVVAGSLPPHELFEQLPKKLRTLFDEKSRENRRAGFLSLSTSDQQSVCQSLLDLAKSPPASEPLTLPEALAKVIDGAMEASDFYDQLPEGFQKLLDLGSEREFAKGFLQSDPSQQEQVCRGVLCALDASSQPNEDAHHASTASIKPATRKFASESTSERVESRSHKRVSVAGAFELAVNGEITGQKLYNALSARHRKPLDAEARRKFKLSFCDIDPSRQQAICKRALRAHALRRSKQL